MKQLTPVQRQWVEALRSGRYQQATGALCDGDRFCCLGVLCELAIAAGLPIKKDSKKPEMVMYDGCIASLPESVKRWAGMKTAYGSISDHATLASQNDDGKTFPEIADVIEQHADELFVEAQP